MMHISEFFFFFFNIFGMVFPSELYLNSEPEILVQ